MLLGTNPMLCQPLKSYLPFISFHLDPLMRPAGYFHFKVKETRHMEFFCCSAVETNLTSTHEDVGYIPGLVQWFEDSVLP